MLNTHGMNIVSKMILAVCCGQILQENLHTRHGSISAVVQSLMSSFCSCQQHTRY